MVINRMVAVVALIASIGVTTLAGPVGTDTALARKKVTGRATPGAGNATESTCETFAELVNYDLDKMDQALAEGDPGAAAGWREAADNLLSGGMAQGCQFSASLKRRAFGRPTHAQIGGQQTTATG